MQLTENFTLKELTTSYQAQALGIANEPNAVERSNLLFLAKQLEKIRAFLDESPICINSAFRCAKLNQAVGGVANSAHRFGLAADIRAAGFSAVELAHEIEHMSDVGEIDFDQLILEFPERGKQAWVHVGFSLDSPRSEVLTAVKRLGKTVYLKGLVA